MTRGTVQYHSTQQHRKVINAIIAIGDSFELETTLSPSLLISAPVFLALRSGYMYVRPMVTLLPILICIDSPGDLASLQPRSVRGVTTTKQMQAATT